MKISPVRKYRTPAYPTLFAAQLDSELLSRIPGRWRKSPKFAAALGLLGGLTTRLLVAAEVSDRAVEAKAAVTQAPGARRPAPDKPSAARDVHQATAVVAPLLEEALQYDGRGSFGCVAVNPPTFLSEDEALEIIRTELEAAGLKLKEDVDLDDVEAPVAGGRGMDAEEVTEDEDGNDRTISVRLRHDPGMGRASKLAPRSFSFDLADADRSVFIEYLSARDHTDWEGSSMSTVSSYDFPALARKVSNSFQKRRSDKQTVFGVFFDPLARTEIVPPQVSGLTREQERVAYQEYRKAQRNEWEHLNVKAKAKLRKQVQNFVAFLTKSGIVGQPK